MSVVADTPRTLAEVSAFIRDFEACRLPKARWTHEGHLVAGLWYVWHLGAAEALKELRVRIARHNTSVGTLNTDSSGYHETITRLYVEEIGRFCSSWRDESMEAALSHLLSSPLADSKWPLTRYTAAQLFSVQARRGWVPPMMSERPHFKAAYPYQKDVLSLPVTDIDAAARWYSAHFGMAEVERRAEPVPTVILERDGTRIGFAVNGGDAAQDGAAILVTGIAAMKAELESKGVELGNWRVDERDGRKLQVFFVVAPDALCYYFHEPLE